MLEKCPYCSTKVKNTDEQVNCPSCGTLYHYTCWKHFTEKCANCGLENDDYKEAKRKAEERKVEECKLQQEQSQEETESVEENIPNVVNNIKNKINNEETGMFANIGDKLKGWAKASFVLGIVLGIIIAIATFFIGADDLFIAGIGAGVIEFAGAWAFSLILYAFGELVANSKESKRIQQEILNELRKNK
jgi:hypothetical protein